MKMMPAENIRSFRKERSLTQEQLAEALGATAMDGVRKAVSQVENEALTALWKSINAQEGLHE